MKRIFSLLLLASLALSPTPAMAQTQNARFVQGGIWPDTDGHHINAHGGGLLEYGGRFYWFGEEKASHTSSALTGVSFYVSDNLRDWQKLPTALAVDTVDETSPIARGCTLERPKVVFCERTGKFVMWFHLELKGQGYGAALAGVAQADRPEGPYRFVRAERVNAGILPFGMSDADIDAMFALNAADYPDWWTPEWRDAVGKGLFCRRDLKGGQMARDQQIYVDDDGTAYHIYSSEENLTLQIAELTPDYLSHTGKYIRVAPGHQNEAPCIFRHGGYYWLVCSGCTGWAPNAARLYRARSIWGPWEGNLCNPCCEGTAERPADKTFLGQGTQIFPLRNAAGDTTFVFMADEWHPKNHADGRYLWLPIRFDDEGIPEIPFTPDFLGHRSQVTGHNCWRLLRSAQPNCDL